MINYLKNCQQTTLIGQLPDIINSNNESIKNEFNWIFDSSLNRLTKSVYAPTGSVKSHFGEFVNLACEYLTVKNIDSFNHNLLGNRFSDNEFSNSHNYTHDAKSIVYKKTGVGDECITVYDALASAAISGGSPFEKGIGEYSVTQKGCNDIARGNYSMAVGLNTTVTTEAEFAEGKYNRSNENTIHSIGIGTNNIRRNAVEVLYNGDVFLYGIGEYDGTNINIAYSLQRYIKSLEERIDALEHGIPMGDPISQMTSINDSSYIVSSTTLTVNSSNYLVVPNISINGSNYLI